MPHYPKPFFRAPRGLWYVQIDSRQVNLGPDRDEAPRRFGLEPDPFGRRVLQESIVKGCQM